jgi:hypothetical protein
MLKNSKAVNTHRVITMLNREELEFLDKLGKDSLFSTGHKLSYNEILRSLIDFAMEIPISGEKIDSQKTLKDKILAEICRSINKKE